MDEHFEVGARLGRKVRVQPEDYLIIKDEVHSGEDFSGLKLKGLDIIASRFEGCNFEKARIENACFGAGRSMSFYSDSSFDGSRIGGPSVGRARFERCSFRGVRLKEWFAWNAEFVDCEFEGEALGVVFFGAVEWEDQRDLGRSANEFRRNDFTGFRGDYDFRRGIDLSQQSFSDDGVLIIEDPPSAISHARSIVSGWDDDTKRVKGLGLLRILDEDFADGQEQLMIDAEGWRRESDVQRALIELLAE